MTFAVRPKTIFAFAALLGSLITATAEIPFQGLSRQESGIGSPVALAALPSGDVIVLEFHGAVYRISSGTNQVHKLKETLGFNNPVDLAGDRLGDQETFFITSYLRAAQLQSGQGRLSQYSSDGKEISSWNLPGGVFVLALNPRDRIVYLAEGRTFQIYSLNLSSPKSSPAELMEVYGISNLSAITYDIIRNNLYVADVVQGNLYSVDLGQHKTRRIAERLGEPRALAFDSATRKLYIADAGRHRILALNTEAPNSRPTVFSESKELREPSGVAVDAQHLVWVADYGARAVFSLSQSGDIVTRIRN